MPNLQPAPLPPKQRLENLDRIRNVDHTPVSAAAMALIREAHKQRQPEASVMALAYIVRSICETSGIHPEDLLGMAGRVSSEQGSRLPEFRAVDRMITDQLVARNVA